jgi:hypothetical protein
MVHLCCLIEGAPRTSYLSVPYDSKEKPINGDTLRQMIWARKCSDLARNSDSISLLKVRLLQLLVPYP